MDEIARFAVTVRLPKNPSHDPRNKKTGPCPIPPHLPCDDVTGEHHTFLCSGDDLSTVEEVRATFEPEYHVTRVEKLAMP